ncbi:MAG: acyltransferase family protein [Candidatus Amulumruptor caecigallinarius]|nr:acyltransferase family protein [Candidatus Amulumruptor caecigallinarius]MCM1397641.1 acyltransferase family protein [Candidatus Amulumruptor caecigallinarius]MCM1454679.1 acyltransferase family protein [bacterium]
MSNVKKRDSNIELLRIYAMFFITMGHICCKAPRFEDAPILYEWLMSLIGIGTVDIFILITGFFLINKTEISLRRFVKVFVQVVFYNVLIVGILAACGIATPREVLVAAYPLGPSRFNLWFVSQYLALILLQPFLSRLVIRFTHRQYLGFLLLLILLTSTLTPVFPLGYIYSSPWKVTWFITLFFAGGYLRLYLPRVGSCLKPALLYVAACTVGFVCTLLMRRGYVQGWDLGAYNSLVVFAIGVTAMLFASRLKIGHIPAVNYIASSTFAVYIIHQNPYVIEWLMDQAPAYYGWSTAYYTDFLIGMAVTAVVFLLCVAIDKLRLALFYLCRIERLEDRLADATLSLVRRALSRLTAPRAD